MVGLPLRVTTSLSLAIAVQFAISMLGVRFLVVVGDGLKA
jgi:hypothetical protein